MIAPRIGPHIRSQVIGGPACRSMFGFIPGMTSMARSRPTSCGMPLRISFIARAFARSIAARHALTRCASLGSTSTDGFQSTCTDGT